MHPALQLPLFSELTVGVGPLGPGLTVTMVVAATELDTVSVSLDDTCEYSDDVFTNHDGDAIACCCMAVTMFCAVVCDNASVVMV